MDRGSSNFVFPVLLLLDTFPRKKGMRRIAKESQRPESKSKISVVEIILSELSCYQL